MKTLVNASKLRLQVLKEFHHMWEKNPSQNAFFNTQNVWNPIFEKIENKIDGQLATAVFKSLYDDGYLNCIDIPDQNGTITNNCQITPKGLAFLAELQSNKLTHKIAYIGAITGCLGLIVSIIDFLLKVL